MKSTKHLLQSERDVQTAAAILQNGGLVAMPTETVYGLAANATDANAVASIYAAKGRPSFNPLIVHVSSREMATHFVKISPLAEKLMQAFWPGALTIVMPLAPFSGIAAGVTAGLDTLAVRCPDHPVAQNLIAAANLPLAAPSANPSGQISPTTAAHVFAGLDGRIDAVLDAGPCIVGVESTIVSVTDNPQILRHGGITAEDLFNATGIPFATDTTPAQITAPGQMRSHYAPKSKVRLNVIQANADEVMLGFADVPGDQTLSKSGNLAEAASNLFAMLHELDQTGKPIAVAPIPKHGLGLAINDRLSRAAAPKG